MGGGGGVGGFSCQLFGGGGGGGVGTDLLKLPLNNSIRQSGERILFESFQISRGY